MFRKMREKLKTYCRGKAKVPDAIVGAYRREAKELIDEGNELAQPLEFYVDLLKTAFIFLKQNYQRQEKLF